MRTFLLTILCFAAILTVSACSKNPPPAGKWDNWTPRRKAPDISTAPPDIKTPKMVEGAPAAGKRVRQVAPEYAGTQVFHALYLPVDWKPGGDHKYPVLVEYAGNGPYSNAYGDVSTGKVEGSNFGYGISGGKRFIWLCLPYVNTRKMINQRLWWGDVSATIEYCKKTVARVCRDYGGDPSKVILIGFSRGSVACNFIGLHDDQISKLWRAFVPYSHYDGVERWRYAGSDKASALKRLKRLGNRPQFICMENSLRATKKYLESTGVKGNFTFVVTPFRNHSDEWAHRDSPQRRQLRQWVDRVLADEKTQHSTANTERPTSK